MRTVVTLTLLAVFGADARAEIHRCPQADGTVSFQEMPCADVEAKANTPDEPVADAATADDNAVFESPFDRAPPAAEIPEAPDGLPSRERSECEKTTRDAIDAIDLEMRKGYSKEEGEAFLAELLKLTQQLRACKTL